MRTEEAGGTFWGAATVVINVVFAFGKVGGDRHGPDLRRFTHGNVAFSHYDNFVTRYVIFLESFADDFFGFAVGVDIRCIPGIESYVVGSFENWKGLDSVSIGYRIVLQRDSLTLSSPITQGCHCSLPKDIAPSMGTETFKPLLPSCLYSTLVLSMESWTDLGIASMLDVVVALGFVLRGFRVYQEASERMLYSRARIRGGGFL